MLDAQTKQRLRQNWLHVQREIHQAAECHQRDPKTIQVIGVSKYVDVETTMELVQAGCHQLAESRPQSLWQKAESPGLDATVQWHLIGHLQRNKVRRTLRHQPLIHSIDSERLLEAVSDQSRSMDLVTRVLFEVNISGDEAKTGFAASQLDSIMERLPLPGVKVCGLMAMAGWGTDPDHARIQFEQTHQLRDALQQKSGHPLPELSMGMSGDFVAAIAAGATMVRIGSRLFDGVIDGSAQQ